MNPRTDFSTKLPVWYQIAMLLRSDILVGVLPPGARIEPEVQLAERHGVSVMPVRQALRSLEAEGMIVRQRGRGTFVSDHGRAQGAATSLESLYTKEFDRPAEVLERGIGAVPPPLAGTFAPETSLAFLRRIAFRDGRPWSYGTLYYLTEFDDRITTELLLRYPLYRILDERCGVHLQRSAFEARAVAASPDVAAHLAIDAFSPVLKLTAHSSDAAGRAVGAFQVAFVSDIYAFSFETLHGRPTGT